MTQRPWAMVIALGLLAGGCDDASGSSPADDAAVVHDAGAQIAIAHSVVVSPSHSCALRTAGLFCWGDNFSGQLGTADTEASDVPVEAIAAGSDIVEVAAHTGRTCVRRSTGEVACWGGNEQGQIGDGTRTNALTAVAADGVDDAIQIAIDDISTCALRARDRSVMCWGASPARFPDHGSLLPQAIADLSGVVELRAGVSGSYCARGAEGWTKCWKLEDGAWTVPVTVDALADARAIGMAARDEVCAIMQTSEVRCHDLANGKTVALDDSDGSVAIAGGMLALCAVNTAGDWHCWNVLAPMLESVGSPALAVPAEVPFVELAISGFNVCVLRADERVACGNANDTPPVLAVVDGLPP